jgi:phosphoribosylformimino-5-aminoimidazole carboxamide ribonucleotide (ProFAR) isomerase
VGGESNAALRRAARDADGWIGMGHTLESAKSQIEKLRAMREELHDPDGPLASGHDFQICVGGPVRSKDDVSRWEDLGVTRLVVAPWASSRQAVEGMTRYAELVGLSPR